MATQDEIQQPLEALMMTPPYCHYFTPPEAGVGEFRLGGARRPYRADACYVVRGGGYLFIEHDNAQTGLNNLAKYWHLIASKKLAGPIFIVHLIDDKRPGASQLCRFMGDRFEQDLHPAVKYFLHEVSDWHAPAEWQGKLVASLMAIISMLTGRSP